MKYSVRLKKISEYFFKALASVTFFSMLVQCHSYSSFPEVVKRESNSQ